MNVIKMSFIWMLKDDKILVMKFENYVEFWMAILLIFPETVNVE